MILSIRKNLLLAGIKIFFKKAQKAKQAGNKKKALKAFDRAINLYLKKWGGG